MWFAICKKYMYWYFSQNEKAVTVKSGQIWAKVKGRSSPYISGQSLRVYPGFFFSLFNHSVAVTVTTSETLLDATTNGNFSNIGCRMSGQVYRWCVYKCRELKLKKTLKKSTSQVKIPGKPTREQQPKRRSWFVLWLLRDEKPLGWTSSRTTQCVDSTGPQHGGV